VHTVDHFDSEGWFGWDKLIFLMCLCVCWQNSMQHLGEKPQILGFVFSQIVQRLEIKHLLIAYFLSNISAKKMSKSLKK